MSALSSPQAGLRPRGMRGSQSSELGGLCDFTVLHNSFHRGPWSVFLLQASPHQHPAERHRTVFVNKNVTKSHQGVGPNEAAPLLYSLT